MERKYSGRLALQSFSEAGLTFHPNCSQAFPITSNRGRPGRGTHVTFQRQTSFKNVHRLTKESQSSPEAPICSSPAQLTGSLQTSSPRHPGTELVPRRPLPIGDPGPHAGRPYPHPQHAPRLRGGVCDLGAAAGGFESGWRATAAANASSGPGCTRGRAQISPAAPARGTIAAPPELLTSSISHLTPEPHLGGGSRPGG